MSPGLRSLDSCFRDLSADLSFDPTLCDLSADFAAGLSASLCLALRSLETCLSLLRCRLRLRLTGRRVYSSPSDLSAERCLRLRRRSFCDALGDRRLGLSWRPVRLCSSSAELMERFLALLILLSYLDRLSAFGSLPISWEGGRPWVRVGRTGAGVSCAIELRMQQTAIMLTLGAVKAGRQEKSGALTSGGSD